MKKLILIAFIVFVANAKAQIISTVAGDGAAGFFGDGGAATAAVLYDPRGLTFDVAGNMYIADYGNSRVRMINTAGVISTFVSGVGLASGVAFDVFGNLYITNLSDNYVRKITTAGSYYIFAGNGTGGYTGDGGPATAAELHQTAGVACDMAGNVYISDYSNNRIRMVNTAGIISTFAGGGSSGLGDGGPATAAGLGSPEGLCFDGAGNLYIADLGNNRIRKVNTAGIITTVAGNGTLGYAGDGGQATAAALQYPMGVSFDAIGNMYIADQSNDRIRRVSTAGIISTIAGNGYDAPSSGGYAGDGGPATAAELNHPSGVGFDAAGNLYIADNNNDVIRKVTCTPVVNISGVNSVCPGGGTMLTASGANTYAWSSNAGGVLTSTVTLSPAVATVYTVTGTSVFGCTATQTISVHINSLPIVSIGGNSSICIGAHTILTGMGANTYTWNSGSNTNAISVNPTSNTTYTVTGTDGNGCENSDTITVVVNPLPVITVNSGTICAGQAFTITPSGANTYTYSSGSAVVTPTVNTTYTVKGTDGNDCVNTPAATCTVMVNASPIISVNTSTICTGSTATLTASGANTYTWNTGATGASISPSPTVTTNYTVTGTDANNCMNTDTLSVIVVDCTTGIEQFANINELNIYPNPNKGNFVIEPSSATKQTMQVYDVNGKLVLSQSINGKTTIDASSLNEGVYNISLTSGEGVVNKRVVIVKD
jgi:type IX secretion system substrate protein/NHL repeat-containing protein